VRVNRERKSSRNGRRCLIINWPYISFAPFFFLVPYSLVLPSVNGTENLRTQFDGGK